MFSRINLSFRSYNVIMTVGNSTTPVVLGELGPVHTFFLLIKFRYRFFRPMGHLRCMRLELLGSSWHSFISASDLSTHWSGRMA